MGSPAETPEKVSAEVVMRAVLGPLTDAVRLFVEDIAAYGYSKSTHNTSITSTRSLATVRAESTTRSESSVRVKVAVEAETLGPEKGGIACMSV
jgi:hypothetical protein